MVAGLLGRFSLKLHIDKAVKAPDVLSHETPARAPRRSPPRCGTVLPRCTFDTTFHSPLNVNNDENGVQIWTCTGPHGPWRSFWPALRHYD
jgi:hypothetical protein